MFTEETKSSSFSNESSLTPAQKAAKRRQDLKQLIFDLFGECELFLNQNSELVATFAVNGHFENALVKSELLSSWIRHEVYTRKPWTVSDSMLSDCIGVIEGSVRYGGNPKRKRVYNRVAFFDGRIYVDLANDDWQFVEIGADGWRVTSTVPVKFIRSELIKPMATPVHGCSVDGLRRLVNVKDEGDWGLLVSFLVNALWPEGPYPILLITGEQGSSKSKLSALIKRLLDPSSAELIRPPKNAQDLMIIAERSQLVVIDNITKLSDNQSDDLCCLATSGSFVTRKLFTDNGVSVANAMKPIVLNGIDNFATRGDLLDRSISLCLPAISESERMTEADFWSTFDEIAGGALGAIFDAMSSILRVPHDWAVNELPRMADFVKRSLAAARSFGIDPIDFTIAYRNNVRSSRDGLLDESTFGRALVDLANHGGFEGTPTDLLMAIQRLPGSRYEKRSLPHENDVRKQMRRIAPILRSHGVTLYTDLPRTRNARLVAVSDRDNGDICDTDR